MNNITIVFVTKIIDKKGVLFTLPTKSSSNVSYFYSLSLFYYNFNFINTLNGLKFII